MLREHLPVLRHEADAGACDQVRLAVVGVEAGDGDAAAARRGEPGDGLERRAFAGAVAAEQRHGLPFGKLDADAEQDLARPVEHVDVLRLE